MSEHQICSSCPSPVDIAEFYKKMSGLFFKNFDLLHKDIEAAFAAKSKRKIILSYPGFYASIAYRIANTILKHGQGRHPENYYSIRT